MPFPPPENTDQHGLLCVGGELSPEILLEAYSQGIFPWPQEGVPLLWFSPLHRGIIEFSEVKIPRSVKKQVDKSEFKITMDTAFAEVIDSCARVPRDGQTGTWILPEMKLAYLEMHRLGYAHSVEAWHDGQLVGGLYGIFVEGLFSGESMFFKQSGASKVCLVFLIDYLKNLGCTWMDIQMVTPVLKMMGGKLVTRQTFLRKLKDNQLRKIQWK